MKRNDELATVYMWIRIIYRARASNIAPVFAVAATTLPAWMMAKLIEASDNWESI